MGILKDVFLPRTYPNSQKVQWMWNKSQNDMNNLLFFALCSSFSMSGFILALYKIMAESKIELETNSGLDNGFSFDDDESQAYFARRFERWRTGAIFTSPLSPIIGFIIVLSGGALNFIYNTWWSSILVLIVGWVLYLILTNILAYRVQWLMPLSLVLSFILIISHIL